MAQQPSRGALPCLFCGKAFRSLRRLTVHLDTNHETWVDEVMTHLGLDSPAAYPVEEYRQALAEALVEQQLPTPEH